jgi:hypothetical protein
MEINEIRNKAASLLEEMNKIDGDGESMSLVEFWSENRKFLEDVKGGMKENGKE